MRLIPINEAEAIIEPFFNGNFMSNTEGFPTIIESWDHIFHDDLVGGSIYEGWQAPVLDYASAPPSVPAIGVRKRVDLDLSGYDRMMIYCNLPYHIGLTIEVEIDGERRTVIDRVRPGEFQREFEGKVTGGRLTEVAILFTPDSSREANIEIFWLGLANSAKREEMLGRKTPYDPAWPFMLREEPGAPEARLGLAFSTEDIPALRERIRTEPYRGFYERLRDRAETWRHRDPEELIGRYMERHDARYHRGRNRDRSFDHRYIEAIALIGLLDDDVELSLTAARMALSIAHCEYWTFTGLMGCFPGSPYHIRSFVEMELLHNLAFVLDWAAHVLTPYGRRVIEDAMVMKGFPQIESDNHRYEYIWHCNQGIAFNYGYLAGLLALVGEYPRYARRIEECIEGLEEGIANYVLPDGGTLEGCGYWIGTFHNVVPQYELISRYRGRPVREVVSHRFRSTLAYPLAMLTTEGGGYYLPVNDAKGHRHFPRFLAAFAVNSTGDERWGAIYRESIAEEEVSSYPLDESSIWDILTVPDRPVEACRADESCFIHLPDSGQLHSVRTDPALGRVLFHLTAGPTHSAHTHEDKGAFILEAAGRALLIDRGVTIYHHPETAIMGRSGYHNLLCPLDENGNPVRQHRANSAGGEILQAEERRSGFDILCDNTAAWAGDLVVESRRRFESNSPVDLVITDTVRLRRPAQCEFRLHAYATFVERENGYELDVEGITVRITPEGWTPETTRCEELGIDYHETPVHLFSLATGGADSHELRTRIEIALRRS